MAKETASSSSEPENNDELEQITIARALIHYRMKEKMAMTNPNTPIPFQRKFSTQNPRPTSPQPSATKSKILPLICQKISPRSRTPTLVNDSSATSPRPPPECRGTHPLKFPAAGAAPYVPIRQLRTPYHGMAPPVTVRTAVPVFSAPPIRPPPVLARQVMHASPVRIAPPVTIRQAVPVFATPCIRKEESSPIQKEDPPAATATAPDLSSKPVTGTSADLKQSKPATATSADLKQSKQATATFADLQTKLATETFADLQSKPMAQTGESEGTSAKKYLESEAETVQCLEAIKL